MSQYGGFWRRLLAYIIDAIILIIAVSIIGAVIGTILGLPMRATGTPAEMIALVSGGTGVILRLVGSWLYSAILESSSLQATFGKKALGMIVTDEANGRLSFGRATGRYFAKIISSLILLIGFFMIGWTRRKQGLHDIIAGTLVHKASSPGDVSIDVEAFR